MSKEFNLPEEYFSKDNPEVVITFETGEEIVVQLFPEVAPQTVNNFIELVKNEFYDKTIMHRVIKNFVVQGGDPTGIGDGGSENKIFGEFTQNGFDNLLTHAKGVISMARYEDMNSATSQYFLMHKHEPRLDNRYAAFGCAVSGLEVIDKFAEVETNDHDKPLVDITVKSIRMK